MKSYMNGAMLSLLALAAIAVKLEQDDVPAEPVAAVPAVPDELQTEITAAIAAETATVLEEDGVNDADWQGGFSDEESEDCGCQCRDCPYDDIVNLPPDLFKDPRVTYEAHLAAEKLEPLIVEMALPWEEIMALDPEELDSQILLPMFEAALEEEIRNNPELEAAIPDRPSHLQEQVNMVLEQLRGMDGMGFDKVDAAADGVDRHTLVTGAGWIDSHSQWEDVRMFSNMTPMVLFFSSEDNADAANEFEDRWMDLQRNVPGAGYFRIDATPGSVGAEIAAEVGVETTPHFMVGYENDALIESDGSDWNHFRASLAKHLKGLEHIETEKVTRETGSYRDGFHDDGVYLDESRIKEDAVYDDFEWEQDPDGEYNLTKTA